MTDLEALFLYRFKEAQDALQDAQGILKGNLTTRAAVNRAYYAIFYATLALVLKEKLPLKTSKHKGVIAFFDKEFILKQINSIRNTQKFFIPFLNLDSKEIMWSLLKSV